MNLSKATMDNIQEVSDDCGTPTPGKCIKPQYSFGESSYTKYIQYSSPNLSYRINESLLKPTKCDIEKSIFLPVKHSSKYHLV